MQDEKQARTKRYEGARADRVQSAYELEAVRGTMPYSCKLKALEMVGPAKYGSLLRTVPVGKFTVLYSVALR